MKVFVTVGTTSFDGLIQSIDEISNKFNRYDFIFQIAEGQYIPRNGTYFKFVDEIDMLYLSSDVVITHAGAGSIYRLLELNKKVIVVPNLVRVDKHQSDIADYMSENGHVLLLSNLEHSFEVLSSIDSFTPVPYVKEAFFVKNEIINFIRESI
ncbi:PssE/Cps14G family polysaccharide biosynthesis glycosyltransferase [Vibrio cholerae]|uniref:PssE/Cps14G family polysaccharide biosynthesis glycosyltransferase n=1 Tax=Vibrio cholerae TaxID=666 RepID=UPI0022B06AE1|nr:PssE/Cps14G family polysaccharide biosynthesis glycosyltransferase [Vibrio cholerae]